MPQYIACRMLPHLTFGMGGISLLYRKLQLPILSHPPAVCPYNDRPYKPFTALAMGKFVRDFLIPLQHQGVPREVCASQVSCTDIKQPPYAFETQPHYFLHIFWTAMNSGSSAVLHTMFLHRVNHTTAENRFIYFYFQCFQGWICMFQAQHGEVLLATWSHFLKHIY